MRVPTPPNHDIWTSLSSSDYQERASEYQLLVQQAEANYLHWHKLRFIARDKGLTPETAWAMVKIGRLGRFRMLPLYAHGTESARYLIPPMLQQELMHIDQNLAGNIGSPTTQLTTAEERDRFVVSALREEAITSSMLEGAATTRDEAKRMLRSGRDPRTRGERMVLNNYRAILFVREHKEQRLTPEFLLRLQGIVTEDTLEERGEAGRFRTENDRIVVASHDGEVVHTPPPAEELDQRVNRLCDFANQPISREDFVHPVLKACALHFQIGFDHPFCDGNGRTARAIFYWSMLRSGYWLFEYLPISRLILESPAKYARAFLYTETDENDLTYFFVYHLEIIRKAREDLAAYIERKRVEHAETLSEMKEDPALNPRQRDTLVWLLRHPGQTIDIESHRSDHGVAYDTARTDLRSLATQGYLVEKKIGLRYVFSPGPRLVVHRRP